MSDEQRKDEETEVEGHMKRAANDEPSAEGEGEDDFEAHRFKKTLPEKD
jgi:hypothetical protein